MDISDQLTQRTSFYLSVLLSLLLHVLVIVVFEIWPQSLPEFKPFQMRNSPKFTIREIKKEKEPKIQKAGKKEAQEKETVLVEEKQGQKEQGEGHQKGQLSLAQLGMSQKQAQKQQPQTDQENSKKASRENRQQLQKLNPQKNPQEKIPLFGQETVADQREIRRELLQDMGVPQKGNAQDITRYGETFLKFEAPKGKPVDELNSLEKMFYGFQVRVYKNYLRSLILAYSDLKPYRPNLLHDLRNGSYQLTGRVTFDKQGNVKAIKIMRRTDNDNIQDLFESALERIDKVPNPPKKLMGESEELNIYYVLKIN